jgi:hypothetical protein
MLWTDDIVFKVRVKLNKHFSSFDFTIKCSPWSSLGISEMSLLGRPSGIMRERYVKPDHKNKKPRHVAENPWN